MIDRAVNNSNLLSVSIDTAGYIQVVGVRVPWHCKRGNGPFEYGTVTENPAPREGRVPSSNAEYRLPPTLTGRMPMASGAHARDTESRLPVDCLQWSRPQLRLWQLGEQKKLEF